MPDVPNRGVLQAEFAKQLGRLNASHRRELETLLGRPPDIANVPADFWAKVETENRERLQQLLVLLFVSTATGRQIALQPSRAESLAQAFAARRSLEVARTLVANTQNRLERASRIWRDRAERGLQITQQSVKDCTASILGPSRAETVATTETTSTATEATKDAKQEKEAEQGVKLKIVWVLGPCNHCSFCPLVAGTDESFWQLFIGGPPAHVNCCCSLRYVAADEKTKPPPSRDRVAAAARASGVFGWG